MADIQQHIDWMHKVDGARPTPRGKWLQDIVVKNEGVTDESLRFTQLLMDRTIRASDNPELLASVLSRVS